MDLYQIFFFDQKLGSAYSWEKAKAISDKKKDQLLKSDNPADYTGIIIKKYNYWEWLFGIKMGRQQIRHTPIYYRFVRFQQIWWSEIEKDYIFGADVGEN